jgi:hypothetical protein
MPGLLVDERSLNMCPMSLGTVPFWVQPVIRLWLVKDNDTSTHLQLFYP